MTTKILIRNGNLNDYSVISNGTHVDYTFELDYKTNPPTIIHGDLTIQEYLDSENCTEYEIIDIDTFIERQDKWHRDQYLTPAVSVTEEQFYEALECLPPMNWVRNGQIETFMCPEYLTGDITAQYGRMGNNYICKNVMVSDKSTHITWQDFYNKNLDEKDLAILATRTEAYNSVQGPRVGDFVEMLDGTMRRFTHNWGDDIQTTVPHDAAHYQASFYLGNGGYADFSGSLDSAIMKDKLTLLDNKEWGAFWFFSHNETRAHNGVECWMQCRAFKQLA